MKRLSILFLLICSVGVMAQLPSGTWRTHLAYTSITQVAETPNKVFGVSEGALFAYDKNTQRSSVYSKIDGLNDNTVSLISYSTENNLLVIVYDNANIDLLTDEGKIYTISDIKDNHLTLNKTINRVVFSGNIAYLSTCYGITALNLTKHEVALTYLLNKKIYSTAIFNGYFYAACDQGILAAQLTSNMFDPNNWTLINTLQSVDLAVFQNTLLAVSASSGLYTVNNSGYQLLKSSNVLRSMFVANNILVVYGLSQLSYYTDLNQETSVSGSNYYGLSALNPAITTWYAASGEGVNRIDKGPQGYNKVTMGIKPDGPFANSPFRLRFSGDKLMVVGGGAWDDRFNTQGLMMFFENEKWSNFRVDTIQAQGISPRDFVDIAEDPREKNHYFVASFGEGVYEFRNNKFVKLHDHNGTGIETVVHPLLPKGINHFDRTDALFFDKDGNLFVVNHGVVKTIKCYKNDGTWTGFPYSPIANTGGIIQILQTKNGLYWAVNARYMPGFFVFDQKNTLSVESDDQYKFVSTVSFIANGEKKSLTPENYFCMKEDKNGELWFGTNKGPFIIKNTSSVFDANFIASRVALPATAASPISSYLLQEENVWSICVDATNRKWIGTEANGVFLVSPDGQQTIFHFTQDNSPMPSNRIQSMDIHPTTGEIFIGTDKGLVSYRNDALTNQKSFTEVYAYPNPVQPEYDGLIIISGLKNATNIRITDSNGTTVFSGTSTDSQISWNGRNASNQRVSTGIYLVYASSSDSLDELVTKITIVK